MNNALVTDDDAAVRTLARRILERGGYAVTEAGDGLEAWELYQRGDFALVVTDLEMPRMRGDELLQRIRAQSPDQKVLLISGSSAVVPTGFPFLAKPFSPNQLRESLAAA